MTTDESRFSDPTELLGRVKAAGLRRRRVRRTWQAGVVLGCAALALVLLLPPRDASIRVAGVGSSTTTAAGADTVASTTSDSVADSTTSTQSPGSTTTTMARGSSTTVSSAASTTTSTSLAPPVFISAAKTDPDSGLVATLSSSADHFTRTGGADFRLVVDNPNDTERVWDSSPGPRFDLLRADGTSAWTDGCQTAYPAIVTSEAIAPGAHVDLAAHYPRAWDDQYAESCAAEPGTYSLSAKFAWCPTYQDRQEGQPPRRSLRCTSEKLVSMPPVQVVVTS